MPRLEAITHDDCTCGNRKLVQSARCRRCAGRQRRSVRQPCPDCGGHKDRAAVRCMTCHRAHQQKCDPATWIREFRRTPEGRAYVRNMNLKRYGLTAADYDEILVKQGGVCAACGQAETHRNQFGVCSLAVDHDHKSGQVRGLLCGRCNRALGLLGDSPDRICGLHAYRAAYQGGYT